MTDTMQDQGTTTEAAAEKRRFEVDYTLEIIEGDLPPAGHGGGGGSRTSPLEVKLEELKGREDAFGKWVLIGKYGKATAAGAAANVLRQRHGRNANAEGYEFAYRKIDQNGSTVNGLFVRYSPDAIVPGAKEEHEAAEKVRLEGLAKAKAEREAAKANGPTGDETTTPTPPADADKVAAAQAKAAAAAQKAKK